MCGIIIGGVNKNYMNIKDILRLKGSISFPYKTEMREWIGEVSLSSFFDTWETGKLLYTIHTVSERYEDIDEAINRFKEIVFSEDNLGIKQSIWNNLNPDKDPDFMDIDEMEKEVREIKIKDYLNED